MRFTFEVAHQDDCKNGVEQEHNTSDLENVWNSKEKRSNCNLETFVSPNQPKTSQYSESLDYTESLY